jgi:hypothetical protein
MNLNPRPPRPASGQICAVSIQLQFTFLHYIVWYQTPVTVSRQHQPRRKTIPIIVVYAFFMDNYVSGLTAGAIK